MNIKFLATGILLSGMLNIAHATPVISLDPVTQSVGLGDQVGVNLDISGLSDGLALGTYDITLSFNAGVVGYSGIQFGSGLDLFGFGDIQSVTPGAGNVEVFELSLDTANALLVFQQHQFTLARLTFDTLSKGFSAFTLSINAVGDAYGNSISTTLQNSGVTVVPEPSALLLLLSGLSGALFMGRRKPDGR